jgi:uncharacterized protein (DUF1810 family)
LQEPVWWLRGRRLQECLEIKNVIESKRMIRKILGIYTSLKSINIRELQVRLSTSPRSDIEEHLRL